MRVQPLVLTIGTAAVPLAALLITQIAVAEPTASNASDAHSLRDDAARAFGDHDFATCEKKATEALKAAKEPQTAGLLGLCEAEQHEWANAAEHLDYAIRFDPRPERVADYQAKQNDVRKLVGAIVVTTTPDGASITLDAKEHGAAPETLFVNPGHYKIEAEKNGLAARIDVDATAGKETPVVLKLEARASAESRPVRPLWPGIVGLGVGAVSLGIAGGLIAVHGADLSQAATLGKGLRCDASHLSADCQKVSDKASAAQTTGDVAGGLFIAGGVGLAAGGGLLIWAVTGPNRRSATKDDAASWTLLPIVGPVSNGVVAAGTF